MTSQLHVTIDLSSVEEGDIIIKEDNSIEQIIVSIGVVNLWFGSKDEVRVLHEAMQEYLETPNCEMCDNGRSATTVEQDKHGNELYVCAEHAEELAAAKPERAADIHYDDTHRSGD